MSDPIHPQCCILFPRKNDVNDQTGCLKDVGHEGAHLCENEQGEQVEWEWDYSCNCEECFDGGMDQCIVYQILPMKEKLSVDIELSDVADVKNPRDIHKNQLKAMFAPVVEWQCSHHGCNRKTHVKDFGISPCMVFLECSSQMDQQGEDVVFVLKALEREKSSREAKVIPGISRDFLFPVISLHSQSQKTHIMEKTNKRSFFSSGGGVILGFFLILLFATIYQASDHNVEMRDLPENASAGYATQPDQVEICASPAAMAANVPTWAKIVGWLLFGIACLLMWRSGTDSAPEWFQKNPNLITGLLLLTAIVLMFAVKKTSPPECRIILKSEYIQHEKAGTLENYFKAK